MNTYKVNRKNDKTIGKKADNLAEFNVSPITRDRMIESAFPLDARQVLAFTIARFPAAKIFVIVSLAVQILLIIKDSEIKLFV